MRISDWSSDVCSSDLAIELREPARGPVRQAPTCRTRRAGFFTGGQCAFATQRFDQGLQMAGEPAHVVVGFIERQPGGDRVLTFVMMKSEEHTSELQSLMRISYAVFCLKKKKQHNSHMNSTD